MSYCLRPPHTIGVASLAIKKAMLNTTNLTFPPIDIWTLKCKLIFFLLRSDCENSFDLLILARALIASNIFSSAKGNKKWRHPVVKYEEVCSLPVYIHGMHANTKNICFGCVHTHTHFDFYCNSTIITNKHTYESCFPSDYIERRLRTEGKNFLARFHLRDATVCSSPMSADFLFHVSKRLVFMLERIYGYGLTNDNIFFHKQEHLLSMRNLTKSHLSAKELC